MIEKFFCRVFISLQPCETEGEEERLGGGKRIYIYIYICMYVSYTLASFARLSRSRFSFYQGGVLRCGWNVVEVR